MNIREYEIENDGELNLKFKGERIGHGSNRKPDSTRWTEVTVFRTVGGKLIGYICCKTQWQGEHDQHVAVAVDDGDELVAWMTQQRHGLAPECKDALEIAGISCAEVID